MKYNEALIECITDLIQTAEQKKTFRRKFLKRGKEALALRCIMSDQESVILPHRNIQSSSGTLRFQFFSDVLYNFVSFLSLLRFGFQTYHYSSLSVSYRSSGFCD